MVLLASALAAPLPPQRGAGGGAGRGHEVHGADRLGLVQEEPALGLVRALLGHGCPWEGLWKIRGAWVALYESAGLVHGRIGAGVLVGRVQGDTIHGVWPLEANQSWSGACFVMRMAPSCVAMQGALHPCQGHHTGARAKFRAERKVGEQCTAHTAHRCAGAKEEGASDFMTDGVQPCVFG